MSSDAAASPAPSEDPAAGAAPLPPAGAAAAAEAAAAASASPPPASAAAASPPPAAADPSPQPQPQPQPPSSPAAAALDPALSSLRPPPPPPRGPTGWEKACCPRRKPAAGGAPAAGRDYDVADHRIPVSALAAHAFYGASRVNAADVASSQGLSAAEAAARLAEFGPNELAPPAEAPEVLKFLYNFLDPFMLMLNVAGWFCLLAAGLLAPSEGGQWNRSNLYLAGVLWLVVLLNVLMTYVQQRQTASVMSGFAKMAPDSAVVLRDGARHEIPPRELVPGDVVFLASGRNSPADVRILFSNGLKCDFSSLTGENEAVRMQAEAAQPQAEESKAIAFSSSGLTEGEAYGLVIRTGDSSMIGKIAALAGASVDEMSTLEADIHHFVKFIAKLAVVSAVVFFIIGISRAAASGALTGAIVLQLFINCFIVVIIANVPEGLPATVITCLTITARRMGARHVFIKKMNIIETLGCASVICSDKTGTITQNRMTVVQLFFNSNFSEAGAKGRPAAPPPVSRIGQTLGSGAAGLKASTGSVGRAASSQSAGGGGGGGSGMLVAPPAAELEREYAGTIGRTLRGFDPETGLPMAGRAAVVPGGTLGRGAGGLDAAYMSTFSAFGTFLAAAGGGGGGLPGVSAAAAARAGLEVEAARRALPAASWRRSNGYMRLVISAGVCNRTVRKPQPPDATGPAPLVGDASDQALFRFVDGIIPVELLRSVFPVIYSQPFNSTVKMMFAIIADPDQAAGAGGGGGGSGGGGGGGDKLTAAELFAKPVAAAAGGAPAAAPATPAARAGQHTLLMKGAPEIILARCSHHLLNGEARPIDADFRATFAAAYERFGLQGMRVLAFAYKGFPARDALTYNEDATTYPTSGLTFLGLTALVDPPKEGVADTVLTCHRAGIRFTMVTGDHPLTAEAISRKVNIITLKTAREVAAEAGIEEEDVPADHPDVHAVVVAGHEIKERLTSDAAWDAVLTKQQVVFARTTPQQKLAIVENYQRLGNTVAVTGDGTNDSPALKRADCGVAMAISGSSVSKAAGDILLMDDNINSLIAAIEEGRVLFDNLKKSIAYTLAHLWPELLPVFLNIALIMPLALPGLIILTIDLFTEQIPAISFSYEVAEGSVMERPPRNPKRDRLVSAPLLIYTYCIAGSGEMLTAMFGWFMVFQMNGVTPACLLNSAYSYWTAPISGPLVCGATVLDAAAQASLYAQSVSAWYAMIILCQAAHVWTCKTRLNSLFDHPVFHNYMTSVGVLVAVVIMVFCIYTPGVQSFFNTGALAGQIYPCALVFWVFILAYTEGIKWMARNRPQSAIVRWLAW